MTTVTNDVNYTVQIGKVDYETYVNDYIRNLTMIYSEEKAKEAEEQFILRCLSTIKRSMRVHGSWY